MPICTAPRLRGPSASSFTATSAGFSGWPVYGAVGATFAATLPVLAITLRAQHLHAEVQVGLVDAIRQLRDALRSQASVRGGITLLAEKGPPALRAYFQHVLDRERALGGFDRGLRDLRMRLSDAVGDQLVDALLVSLSTGGELLSQTLDDLAGKGAAVHREPRTGGDDSRYQGTIQLGLVELEHLGGLDRERALGHRQKPKDAPRVAGALPALTHQIEQHQSTVPHAP